MMTEELKSMMERADYLDRLHDSISGRDRESPLHRAFERALRTEAARLRGHVAARLTAGLRGIDADAGDLDEYAERVGRLAAGCTR